MQFTTLEDLLASLNPEAREAQYQQNQFAAADTIAAAQIIRAWEGKISLEQMILAALIANVATIKPDRSLERAFEVFDELAITAKVILINNLNSLTHWPDVELPNGTKLHGTQQLKSGAMQTANGLPNWQPDREEMARLAATLEPLIEALHVKAEQEAALHDAKPQEGTATH